MIYHKVERISWIEERLEDCRDHLASVAVVPGKARARTIVVVADSSSGAVTSSLVAISVDRVRASGALMQLAAGSSISGIAKASDMLHCIPRCVVRSAALTGQVLLRPTGPSIIAIVRACCTLASNAIITREARAGASLAITVTLVGTLNPRVHIVGIHHLANPSKITRARALRAVRASPLILSIKTLEAFAIVV